MVETIMMWVSIGLIILGFLAAWFSLKKRPEPEKEYHWDGSDYWREKLKDIKVEPYPRAKTNGFNKTLWIDSLSETPKVKVKTSEGDLHYKQSDTTYTLSEDKTEDISMDAHTQEYPFKEGELVKLIKPRPGYEDDEENIGTIARVLYSKGGIVLSCNGHYSQGEYLALSEGCFERISFRKGDIVELVKPRSFGDAPNLGLKAEVTDVAEDSDRYHLGLAINESPLYRKGSMVHINKGDYFRLCQPVA